MEDNECVLQKNPSDPEHLTCTSHFLASSFKVTVERILDSKYKFLEGQLIHQIRELTISIEHFKNSLMKLGDLFKKLKLLRVYVLREDVFQRPCVMYCLQTYHPLLRWNPRWCPQVGLKDIECIELFSMLVCACRTRKCYIQGVSFGSLNCNQQQESLVIWSFLEVLNMIKF